MKYSYNLFVFLSLFFFCPSPGFSITGTDSLLSELSRAIENSEKYVGEKRGRIQVLQNKLAAGEARSPAERFIITDELYKEYRSFQFDSAFAYALKLQETARQLNDPAKISYARMQLGFTMLSSGMFKEALDTLESINLGGLPAQFKADYYELMARACYDLGSYNADAHYTGLYIEKGNGYADSAIALSSPNSTQFFYLSGLKHLKQKRYAQAKRDFQLILNELDPATHQYAVVASSLAAAYRESGELEKAFELLIKASIADVKSATTEALALINVAEMLYGRGEVERAYTYIKKALAEADFYGARQRKIHLSTIMPIIEGERLEKVESQRSQLLVYAVAISVLSLLVVAFLFVIFRQLKQLRLAKESLTEANVCLQEVNEKLQEANDMFRLTNVKLKESNDRLQESNEKLLEANKIKEEYIGYSFHMYHDYIEKLDKIRKDLKRAKKINEVSPVIVAVDVEKERESLYLNFDKIFLKLFPNFVPAFNAFFKEEDRTVPNESGSLTIEQRIFALIRIGVNDHEKIAGMLEYSVRTIYNYKTKVKNKSLLSNEEFEASIMEIKAF